MPRESAFGWFGWFSNRIAGAALGTVMVFALVGGVSYAAEGSVPGNSLYPVKVGFSEEVRGWFAFGDEAKAMWDARRAERRLEEAETLAVAGSLSNDARATLATRLEAHAKAAAIRLGRLTSADQGRIAARVSSELESALRAHEHILLSLDPHSEEDTSNATVTVESSTGEKTSRVGSSTGTVKIRTAGVSPLVAQVRLSIEDIMAIRVQAEGDVVVVGEADLEDEFARAAQAIASARTVLEVREVMLEAAIAAEAKARLADAEESLGKAEKLMQDDKRAEMLVELHSSVRAANEARILARTSMRIEDINELDLPVKLATSTGSSPSTGSGQATSTKSGQGASIIDIFLDTQINSSSSSTTGSQSKATTSSSSQSGVYIESNNSANVHTGVNIKVNTGGL
jgi:hypothetical protein